MLSYFLLMRGLLGQLDSQCQEAKFSLGVDSLFPLWNISSNTTITIVFKMLFLLYMYACLSICEHICLHISGHILYVCVCESVCMWAHMYMVYGTRGMLAYTCMCVPTDVQSDVRNLLQSPLP